MHKFIRVSAILSLTLLSCLLAATDAIAQGVKVSGKVIDANGEPLIAVTVFEDGKTTNGTMTDIDGNYSLTVSSAKSTIVFSCLGFTEVKEVEIKKVLVLFIHQRRLNLPSSLFIMIS